MKELTEEQALAKAAALCSSSEKCTGQILTKLAAWGMDTAQSEHIIQRLQAEKFIDDCVIACRMICRPTSRNNIFSSYISKTLMLNFQFSILNERKYSKFN